MDANPLSAFDPIPRKKLDGLAIVPDVARGMGLRVAAPPGAGKSRLLGRYVAFTDFLRGVPTVVLDPVGPTIDNLLDRIIRLPKRQQESIWPRVRYVDMGGKFGRVVPMPIYYRRGNEKLYVIAHRFLDVLRRADPDLRRAPIQGWNAVEYIGERVGMALAALGEPITAAADLLVDAKPFLRRLVPLVRTYPELTAVIADLGNYEELKGYAREQTMLAFRRTLSGFRLDPVQRAIYGAKTPGIDWDEVVAKRQLVLFDLRHVESDRAKSFAMFWCFRYLREYLVQRGTDAPLPISVVIDELTALLPQDTREEGILTEDMVELTGRIARNHKTWLTLAHQDLNQLSDRVFALLMRAGTQVLGGMSDPRMARKAAERFFRWDPTWVKKYENVWGSSYGNHDVIERRPVEYSIEEQKQLLSETFFDLRTFNFLVGISEREGQLPSKLRRASIAGFETGVWPDIVLAEEVRRRLSFRDGLPIGAVFEEPPEEPPAQERPKAPRGPKPTMPKWPKSPPPRIAN